MTPSAAQLTDGAVEGAYIFLPLVSPFDNASAYGIHGGTWVPARDVGDIIPADTNPNYASRREPRYFTKVFSRFDPKKFWHTSATAERVIELVAQAVTPSAADAPNPIAPVVAAVAEYDRVGVMRGVVLVHADGTVRNAAWPRREA